VTTAAAITTGRRLSTFIENDATGYEKKKKFDGQTIEYLAATNLGDDYSFG
jgi:hypothetical protein